MYSGQRGRNVADFWPGITDQLVAEGLVERMDVEGDRRAYLVRLTPQGREQFNTMARQHEQWIVEAFATLGERDIATYTVIEHDGVIFGCAALYPYPEAKTAEMAAVTVSPQSQGTGDGEKLLKRIEQRARAMGLDSIFVLTTRTMHWFIKRGFQPVDPDWLPDARKRKYNWDRRSQVLVKKL